MVQIFLDACCSCKEVEVEVDLHEGLLVARMEKARLRYTMYIYL
jgi:hypothetical protein